MDSAATPVAVIGGYLGAGKTTLVNHLLGQPHGLRLAVLVNDFGAIAIDAALVTGRSASVISISGGCVCCSYGSDLVSALQALMQGDAPPQQVIIETSGVALPRVVLQTAALVPGLRAQGVTVVADAQTLLVSSQDRYIGDTVQRQIAQADLVLLNKVDIATALQSRAARDWVRAQNPVAGVIETSHGRIDLASITSARRTSGSARRDASLNPAPAADIFQSEEFAVTHTLDVETLARELAQPALALVRAKGLLRGADGRLHVLQLAGGQVSLSSPAQGEQAQALGLVCIALKGNTSRAALEQLIADCAIFFTNRS